MFLISITARSTRTRSMYEPYAVRASTARVPRIASTTAISISVNARRPRSLRVAIDRPHALERAGHEGGERLVVALRGVLTQLVERGERLGTGPLALGGARRERRDHRVERGRLVAQVVGP